MTGSRPRARGALPFLMLVAGAAAIAFAPIFVRLAETGPVATAFWRVFLALPFAWLWFWRSSRIGTPRGTSLRSLVVVGLFFAGDLGIWHVSIRLTSVANSTLLVNMAPIFVTIGGWFLFRERVTRLFLAGLALALIGAAILVRGGFSLSREALLGDSLALVAALCYAGYILSIKHARSTWSTPAIMAWGGLFTCLGLLPWVLVSGEQLVPSTPQGWLTLLGLAAICQLAGQSLITWAMAHLPASFSSVTLLTQPVLAAGLAWLILSEPVVAVQAAGGAAVLAGIYLARRASNRE